MFTHLSYSQREFKGQTVYKVKVKRDNMSATKGVLLDADQAGITVRSYPKGTTHLDMSIPAEDIVSITIRKKGNGGLYGAIGGAAIGAVLSASGDSYFDDGAEAAIGAAIFAIPGYFIGRSITSKKKKIIINKDLNTFSENLELIKGYCIYKEEALLTGL
ncbi:MAG: hypothetical protein HKO90_08025 [Flavobacteriaceae bacterium]|nr:hypothetical protein [Flavobacteriaceae bacterium]